MELHLRAMECHLSYGITQCYLSPNTSELTPARQAGIRQTDKQAAVDVHLPCK